MQKNTILFFFLLCFSLTNFAQAQTTETSIDNNKYWSVLNNDATIALPQKAKRYTIPQKYSLHRLQLKDFKKRLAAAPAKGSSETVAIQLPMPNGSTQTFFVTTSSVMHPNLAARYPMIRTYSGYNKDKSARVYLDFTTKGIHAAIDTNGKTIYIDPYAVFQDDYYISYYTSDLVATGDQAHFACGVDDAAIVQSALGQELNIDTKDKQLLQKSSAGDPIQLRTYRMAIACTGEFTDFHGGTTEDGLSAIVTILNRLNMVFERDLAIHMQLVENNDQIIYLNGNVDPFTNADTGALIDESQATIDDVIGWPFYDMGHVFSRGGYAGLAQLGAVCSEGKARGASTLGQPVGDVFAITLVGHEMGHQFGANHSMSSCHNVNSGTAYEPGSGSTIMSYAGICGPENNSVNDSDEYYFTYSLTEIFRYTRDNQGNGCADRTNTGNTTPDVNIPEENGFYIPISTPFEMTVDATDAEGDYMTYAWEQLDLGPMSIPGAPMGSCPLFRSFPPNDNPTRVFPKMQTIVNNTSDRFEILPAYSRDMTFRCTVRDNNMAGGGVSWDVVEFEATDTAGPFLVKSPNTAMTWDVGAYVEVEWEVANTDKELVNCQAVDILLSLDGGYTYPITLASNAINDGSDFVLVPNEVTNEARIKIKASNNIFFDISNTNFTIGEPTTATYSLAASPNFVQVCLPEVISIDINSTSLLGYDEAIELSVLDGLPADAMSSFSKTSIMPSESSQLFLDFSNVLVEDTYEIMVQAVSNTDTLVRSIVLTTVSNDYTNLVLQTPNDGNSGVLGLPEFNWAFAEDADFYTLQLATNPSFATESIIDEAFELTEAPYTPSFIIDENTLYYWRVLPHNECGEGVSSKIFAFHTKSISCNKEAAFDTPIQISGSTAPTLESRVSVFEAGTISDINISKLKGSHAFFSDLRMTLTSPAGTSVVLFAGKCANFNGNFNLTLDDEAPVAFSCPPNGTMRPQQALAAFIGESTEGQWTLKIEDTVGGGGSGGIIDDWSLEFCADINLSNPDLLKNETLLLPPATSRAIDADFLYAEDSENADWELNYTLVENVKNGQLLLDGNPLSVGDKFNQGQITWNQVRYQHDGSDTTADRFDFTIADGDGGWTGTHTFNIAIDPDAVVSTSDLAASYGLEVFPNPADKYLNLQLNNATEQFSDFRLFNVLGERILVPTISRLANSAQVDVSKLSKGVYIIQVQVGTEWVSQKVSVL